MHGDFRHGNILISPDGVEAALDWELTHIGDPLEDIGWICTNSWRFGVAEKVVGGFGDLPDLLEGYKAAGGGDNRSGRSTHLDRLRLTQMGHHVHVDVSGISHRRFRRTRRDRPALVGNGNRSRQSHLPWKALTHDGPAFDARAC